MIKELTNFFTLINPPMFIICTGFWMLTEWRINKYFKIKMVVFEGQLSLMSQKLSELEVTVYSHPQFEGCGHWIANSIKAEKERIKQ